MEIMGAESGKAACPVCRSWNTTLLTRVPDIELRTSESLFEYWDCAECDSIFIHPFPLDRLAEIYPDNYYSTGGPDRSLLTRLRESLDRRLFGRVLRSIKGESLSALDIGGGTGWMLNLARNADSRLKFTAIVDLSWKSADIAKKNGHMFFCSRIEDFKSDKKFDLIIMLNLIEHVADPERVLRKIAGLLSERGKVIVKTPNTKTLDRFLFQRRYWGGYHSPRHWVLFNKLSFIKTVNSAGLAVESLRYTQGAPQWTASVLGSLAIHNKVKITRAHPMHSHFLSPILLILFALVDFVRAPFFPTAQMIVILKQPKLHDELII